MHYIVNSASPVTGRAVMRNVTLYEKRFIITLLKTRTSMSFFERRRFMRLLHKYHSNVYRPVTTQDNDHIFDITYYPEMEQPR